MDAIMKPKISILDVAPKDIQFLVEMNSGAVNAMLVILDNMVFNFDGSKEEHIQAKDYLETQLYPLIKEAKKTLEGANGS